MKILLLVLLLSYTDGACLQQCIEAGYSYGYCARICSY